MRTDCLPSLILKTYIVFEYEKYKISILELLLAIWNTNKCGFLPQMLRNVSCECSFKTRISENLNIYWNKKLFIKEQVEKQKMKAEVFFINTLYYVNK